MIDSRKQKPTYVQFVDPVIFVYSPLVQLLHEYCPVLFVNFPFGLKRKKGNRRQKLERHANRERKRKKR